jgi:DNA polymerase-3 subunit delta
MNPLDEIGLASPRGGVFYLHGEDEFRKEEVVSALVQAHLDPSTRDFNLDPLRGSEVDAETLASILATPPMMAEWRVVVLRETERLAGSPRARQILLDTAESPPPGLALVLSCTVPDGSRAKLYKELARKARAVEFKAFTPADVPGWLMERATARYGVEMDVPAAQALGAAIGTNLGILNRELEKLADFVGDRKTITVEDVEAAGTQLPTQDRWRWFDLVGQGRFREAHRGLEVLLGQGENGVGLVIGLTSHFLRLGIAAEAGSGALQAALPPHQRWLAGRLADQAKGWRMVEIDAALEGLLRADRLLKSSPLSDLHLLEEWLLTVMARRAVA